MIHLTLLSVRWQNAETWSLSTVNPVTLLRHVEEMPGINTSLYLIGGAFTFFLIRFRRWTSVYCLFIVHWCTKDLVCNSLLKAVGVWRFSCESHHRSWTFKCPLWRWSTDYYNEKYFCQSSVTYNFPTPNECQKICATWRPFSNPSTKNISWWPQHRMQRSKRYQLCGSLMAGSLETHVVQSGSIMTFA